MFLDMLLKEVLCKIVEVVGEVNEENGVLLLVDMGLLSMFLEEIVC